MSVSSLEKQLCAAIVNGRLQDVISLSKERKIHQPFDVETRVRCKCWSTMVGRGFSEKPPDIGQLAERIEDGACVCLRDDQVHYNRTVRRKLYPLALACYYGQTEIVAYILKADRSKTVLRRYNMPPLLMAALSTKRDSALNIAELLLGAGMCVKSTERTYPYSALHHAVYKKHPQLVQLLLSRDPSSVDYDHRGLVLRAVWWSVGNPECMEILVRAGASVLRPCVFYCPTAKAIQKLDVDALRILVESKTFQINHTYRSFLSLGGTILEVALKVSITQADQNKFKEMLNFLISRGPSKEIWNLTRIYSKIQRNRSQFSSVNVCAEVLLERGDDPDVVDDCGWSPLVHAVLYMEDKESSVKVLLKHNVDLSRRYRWVGMRRRKAPPKPRSILYIAYDLRKHRMAETMLNHGLNIHKEAWIHRRKADFPMGLRKGIAAKIRLEGLKERLRKPSNLLQLCRDTIRRHYKTAIVRVVGQLGLSEPLQKFLMYE